MDLAWPQLREELALAPGPTLRDGQPSWTLHDPVRGQFFRIDWLAFEILSRWSLGQPGLIAESIAQSTTLRAETADVRRVATFLIENQLVQITDAQGAARLAEWKHRLQGSPLQWLLHHYLFFRIPLLRPDAWLGRWQGIARWFASRWFLGLSAAALGGGMALALRHDQLFLSTLVDTLSLEGLVAYGAALFTVKVLHELGHAFRAKHFGCRVPTMGIAFIVLWPMAYTDTNEVWRLTNRWHRLQVAIAGVTTELLVGAWALLAWGLLPEGALRGVAFFLCTTSLVATLTINASPFMRFDGYFILSDLLDMPNLHARSFALARWRLRELLFGLGEEPPEHFAPARQTALILFAWATWLYRLVVFIGIAVLVYHFFFKALGVVLFAVEIWWFIGLPVWREVKTWGAALPAIRGSPQATKRSRWTLGFILAALLLVVCPWPGRVYSMGLLRSADIWTVYAPGGARLVGVHTADGARVRADDQILTLAPPDLQARTTLVQGRLAQMEWAVQSAGLAPSLRSELQVSESEMVTAQKQWQALREEEMRFKSRAATGGVVRDLPPDLHANQWIPPRERLAQVVNPERAVVVTYLDDEQVRQIRVGQEGVFLIEAGASPPLRVTVVTIDADATRSLPDPQLAVAMGGHVMTRPHHDQLVPEASVYRVVLRVTSPSTHTYQHIWRGRLTIRTEPYSPIGRYARQAVMVLLREAGF